MERNLVSEEQLGELLSDKFVLSVMLKEIFSEYDDQQIEEVGSGLTFGDAVCVEASASDAICNKYFIFYNRDSYGKDPNVRQCIAKTMQLFADQVTEMPDGTLVGELNNIHTIWIIPVGADCFHGNQDVTYAFEEKRVRNRIVSRTVLDRISITYIFVSPVATEGETPMYGYLRKLLFQEV